LEIRGAVIDLAIDNPLDGRVIVTVQYLFGAWKINLRVVSSKAIEWAIDNIYSGIHKNKAKSLDFHLRIDPC
jgi:hypothetical protein